MKEQWFQTIDTYRQYAVPGWRANYRLPGVGKRWDVLGLTRSYIRNHRDGIMCDGIGQVANICMHADVHGIPPRLALHAIRVGIRLLGSEATSYQRRTLVNVETALSHLRLGW